MYMFLMLAAVLLLGMFLVFFPMLPIVLLVGLGVVIYRAAARHHAHHGLHGH